MAIKLNKPIYELVEKHLKLNPQPMTSADLMEIDEVRTEALNEFGGVNRNVRLATNKLSDVLGFLRRKCLITRFPSVSKRKSRLAYQWAEKRLPTMPIKSSPAPFTSKPPATIVEKNGVVEIDIHSDD